jgi:hypothetical protein
MKKKVVLVLLSLLCLSGIATAGTPIRFCFLPEVAVPVTPSVYGLNFGIFTGKADLNQEIAGLDLAVAGSLTGVDGAQISLVNFSKGTEGLQLSLINVGQDMGGLQLGGLNVAQENSSVCQIGLMNTSSVSKSVQVGVINVMDNGFLPICLILNFSVSDRTIYKCLSGY